MKTPMTQFRIAPELKERFRKVCEKKGISMSDVVREMIEDYVNLNTVGLDQDTSVVINDDVDDDWRRVL
ncbi:MAG: hypothetical protein CMA53_04135 [Euryarchaeota archaeon]|jgi:antitoxin component of RelBE/YafQ-DinJ toxin-antitoxin module|nr:hypothetical protein [Euryarchaeota archaeon]|tara:strand:- start:1923 stop:2129 length:207 start_codon:yes stop_codon:yes gene_type:complete